MEIGALVQVGEPVAVVAKVYRTTDAWERLRGLLGRKPLEPDEGLLIDPCGSVHTMFMRYPIDIVYLSRDYVVTRVVHALRPWRASVDPSAAMTLELGAGGARHAALEAGTALRWAPRPDA